MNLTTPSPALAVQNYRMIDVGEKLVTARRALAEGRIELTAQVFELVANRALPKGDALALAEIAGVMAAKNTALLIPLCHPLPLDSVRVSCTLESQSSSVLVRAEVRTTAKTGVEMEALVAVQAALLTIYDLCKGTDPALKIGDIILLRKEGGKTGLWEHPTRALADAKTSPAPQLDQVRVAVVTISDRCYEGKAEDSSGSYLVDALEQEGALVSQQFLVPDEIESIRQVVDEAANRLSVDLVICTGGTGLGPRDITPEALSGLWERDVPGFGELLRSAGSKHTPLAYLSRSAAGILGQSLIVALPGSPRAVREGLTTLMPLLPHALHIVKGGQHNLVRPR